MSDGYMGFIILDSLLLCMFQIFHNKKFTYTQLPSLRSEISQNKEQTSRKKSLSGQQGIHSELVFRRKTGPEARSQRIKSKK